MGIVVLRAEGEAKQSPQRAGLDRVNVPEAGTLTCHLADADLSQTGAPVAITSPRLRCLTFDRPHDDGSGPSHPVSPFSVPYECRRIDCASGLAEHRAESG